MSDYVGLRQGKLHESTEISEYYCGRCGYPVTDHDSFCRECGWALHESDEYVCKWIQSENGFYYTSCGETFEFANGDLSDNKARFCMYCGGRIVQ